jgi:hypothetical protein
MDSPLESRSTVPETAMPGPHLNYLSERKTASTAAGYFIQSP